MARGCGKRPRKTAKQIWIRKFVMFFLYTGPGSGSNATFVYFVACSDYENMCILILHKGDVMHLLSTRDDAD